MKIPDLRLTVCLEFLTFCEFISLLHTQLVDPLNETLSLYATLLNIKCCFALQRHFPFPFTGSVLSFSLPTSWSQPFQFIHWRHYLLSLLKGYIHLYGRYSLNCPCCCFTARVTVCLEKRLKLKLQLIIIIGYFLHQSPDRLVYEMSQNIDKCPYLRASR